MCGYLRSSRIHCGGRKDLLGVLFLGGTEADHPYEQNQDNDEDSSSGNTTCYEQELTLGLTLLSSEGACAFAERHSYVIFLTFSLILAEIVAIIKTIPSVSFIESTLALAHIFVLLNEIETVGVGVTKNLLTTVLTRIVALILAGRTHCFSACAIRALEALRGHGLGLVRSLGARHAVVDAVLAYEVGAGLADRQDAGIRGLGPRACCGDVGRAGHAGAVDLCGSEGSLSASLATLSARQLVTSLAFFSTFLLGDSFFHSSGHADVAAVALDLAFRWLEVAVTAGAAFAFREVEEATGRTLLEAATRGTGTLFEFIYR